MKSKSFTISPPKGDSYIATRSPLRHSHGNNSYQNPLSINCSLDSNSRMQTPTVISDPVLINAPSHLPTPTGVNGSSFNHHPQQSVNPVIKDASTAQIVEKIARKLKCLRTIITIYLILVFTFEIAWTYFIVKFQLIADLRSYHENWDEVWIKEFYKSTKNFFLFILILLILAIAIGIASVTTSNKHLAQTFIAVLLIEWVFEFIGVYESRDRNILIYRLVPCTLRPGLLTLMFMFIKNLNAEDEQYAKEANKNEEEGAMSRHLAIQSEMNARSNAANGNSSSAAADVQVSGNRHVSVIPITTNF